jgi:hypothetical protein
MSTAELMISEAPGFTLMLNRKPEHLVEEAMIAGRALKSAVEANRWSIHLGGTNPHLRIEGAQFLGMMFGVTARVLSGSTHPIELGQAHGWQAEAETVHGATQTVWTRASAQCLSDEENWSLRQKYEGRGDQRRKATDANGNLIMVPTPSFQLRSMAETRACSKAFRLLFGWIYTLHGFAATGAEEMEEDGRMRQPKEKTTAGNRITEAQGKRLWAIAREHGKSQSEVESIITHFGFDSTAAITRDKYDAIIAELNKSDAAE